MTNVYYQPGERRGERVQDLFGSIARRYDLVNDLQSFGLHRLWKRRVVDLAAARAGMSALDVCCGTGDIAAALAATGATVTGVDFSPAMLRVACERLTGPRSPRRLSGAGVLLVQGDAQNLPFAEKVFDAVTVGYGLRNLASWRRGLEEMWRVTKEGGRVVVLDFGKPPNRLWRGIYFGYLGACVPLFGRVFCRNAPAYAYILESLKHFPAQQGIAEQMRNLGGREVRVLTLLGGIMAINIAVK